MSALPVPTPVEVLANLMLGSDEGAAQLPPAAGSGVRAALEQAILPALQRPPCLVSFSGGRDSSAILAVATDVARRHGLDAPVPATMRFAHAPASDETDWQELVIAHLGLRERVVVDLHDELDALGPIATGVLRRHGLMWPANAHMHVPLLDRASGGSLLTGAGGDELLDTRASRLVFVARGRTGPRPRDLLRAGRSLLPARVRAALWRRREAPTYPWLTPRGQAILRAALARDAVAWPERWDTSARHWYRTRGYAALRAAVPRLAADHDVQAIGPFLDEAVLAELAAAGGPTGFASRTDAMRALFGDLLPDSVLDRPGKAAFGGAFWGPSFREFAAKWRGEGVDEAHVDVAALRGNWLSPEPDFRTALVLQAAWLASSGDQRSASSS